MKFLRNFNESNDRKDELVKLTNNHLVYLKDDYINFTIRRLNIKKDKKNGYELKIQRYHPSDEGNGIFFNWNDIKYDLISFCEMLVDNSFKIDEAYFFDDHDDKNRKQCLTFNYDDIINDKIGDIILYDVRLFIV